MADRETTILWNGRKVRAVVVPIDSIHEGQSQYQLADGSSLQLRTVVLQVFRVKGEYNADGDPVYVIKSNQMVASVVPDNLKQSSGEGESK